MIPGEISWQLACGILFLVVVAVFIIRYRQYSRAKDDDH